ncbi:MAG: hypothetical protein H0V70_07265 [Ktedonobacteraceae bacterium]|nr:hypothetical protein [Ktedonobacteraceae bacterium]
MPKDREKYRYIDVGLERGSWTLAMFEEDAKRHQMSDQPGKLVTVRLTEYYERKKEWDARASRELLQPLNDEQTMVQRTSEQSRSTSVMQVPGDDLLEISQQEMENADEAADYWGGV